MPDCHACRKTINLTAANGLFDFLRQKQGKQNLPAEATTALCCMVFREGQYWQIGTPNTLQYLTEVYCKGQGISQCWLTWTLSMLGVPAPFGDCRSQHQLLDFLSRTVQVQLSPLSTSHVHVWSSEGIDLCGLCPSSSQRSGVLLLSEILADRSTLDDWGQDTPIICCHILSMLRFTCIDYIVYVFTVCTIISFIYIIFLLDFSVFGY